MNESVLDNSLPTVLFEETQLEIAKLKSQDYVNLKVPFK